VVEQAPAFDRDVVVVVYGWEGDSLSCERMPQPGIGDLSEAEDEQSLSSLKALFRSKNFAKSPKPKMGQQPNKKVQPTSLVF
jgi:hypothetical protein